MRRVAIVGGGASGLAAAVSAARAGAHVVVFERDVRVGKPVLKTGNGRCNLTNMRVAPDAYNDPGFVAPLVGEWDGARVRAWFAELGLCTCEEREGRVYPRSNAAATVVEVLHAECVRAGVELYPGAEVEALRCADGETGGGQGAAPDTGQDAAAPAAAQGAARFFVELAGGENAGAFDAVVVAAGGGAGARLLESCGHTSSPARPVLCPLACDTRPVKGLDGLRVRCRVGAFHQGEAAPFAAEDGELLFRTYGVSGIVVFNMSRLAGPRDELSLDFLPEMEKGEVEDMLAQRARRLGEGGRGQLGQQGLEQAPDSPRIGQATLADLMRGIFTTRLNSAIVRVAGFSPDMALAQARRGRELQERLAQAVKDFRLVVKGPGDAKRAQVVRGGARTVEFDPRTMASHLHPGLFACGEVLDVDGPCGGYNLHWAWASGIVAGASAAAETTVAGATETA